MIIDLFLYNGEKNLLDVRFAELADTVDVFVPVIANRTHQGDPVEVMPLVTSVGAAVVTSGKWHVVDSEPVPLGGLPLDYGSFVPSSFVEGPGLRWSLVDLADFDGTPRGGAGRPGYQVRERAHRDRAIAILDDLPDDAVLLLSDCDEIPRVDAIERAVSSLADGWLNDEGGPHQFMQTMYGFAIDWQMPQPWPGTTAATLGWARKYGVQAMRDARGDYCATLPRGGWHFSWLGGPDEWMRKQQSFSHAELNHRDCDDFMRHWREGVHSNGELLEPVEVDDSYPQLMRDPQWSVPEWWRRPRDPA